MSENKKLTVDLSDYRKPYCNEEEPILLEKNFNSDPIIQFNIWFNDLSKHNLKYEEYNAVALSTCCDNKPSSRMVLLKKFSNDGFSFYTNSLSRKAQEFTVNPNAAMLFYWPVVSRQVRIEGQIKQLPESDADKYWMSRPVNSKIGSKISPQSSVIPSRKFLEDKKKELIDLLNTEGESAIAKPKTWLGYILIPNYFEFWQGQTDRIHDRLFYKKNSDGNWILERLAP